MFPSVPTAPLRAALVSVAVVAYLPGAHAVQPFEIKDSRVEGLQRSDPGTVFAALPFRIGETYNDDKGSIALRSLFAAEAGARTGIFVTGLVSIGGGRRVGPGRRRHAGDRRPLLTQPLIAEHAGHAEPDDDRRRGGCSQRLAQRRTLAAALLFHPLLETGLAPASEPEAERPALFAGFVAHLASPRRGAGRLDGLARAQRALGLAVPVRQEFGRGIEGL